MLNAKYELTASSVTYIPGAIAGVDNVQDAIDAIAGGSVASMTPTVEGIAFGETSAGRTLLGLGVDNTSNNVGLWCSSLGLPQGASNSSSSVTAFFDTPTTGATMIDGVYAGAGGNIAGTNASSSILLERASTLQGVLDLSENTLIANGLVLDPLDEITRSVALVSGEFAFHPSKVDESILIGSVQNTGVLGNDVIHIRTPGGTGTLTMGSASAYIGNGTNSYFTSIGDFRVADYQAFYLNTLRNDVSSGQIAYYEPITGELTYGGLPAVSVPLKQPTVGGTQFGVSSLGNASDVNGRDSFVNYAAGPVALTGVSSVGNNQFQTSTPGVNTFTNCMFLGRQMLFAGSLSTSNTFIAANIIGSSTISAINDTNIIAPRAGSVSLAYLGNLTGFNCVTSGSIQCATDPLYSTVLSSGGQVNPNATNLVLSAQPAAGSITMAASGNTLIQSSGSAITYTFPNFSNCCVLNNGTTVTLPTINNQLVSNHSSLRMPNINAVGVFNSSINPMVFDSSNGLMSPILSPFVSRVYRAVALTAVGGAATFTPGSGINPSTVGYAFNATVRNSSGTVAYVAQIQGVSGTSVTVQVFQSMNAVVGSPTMIPAPNNILVHFSMMF